VRGREDSGTVMTGAMNELFTLTEVLPVDPGTSPFHVRGLYYSRLLDHAKSLPGGRDAFFAELEDPRVRTFLEQKFAWSEWYDALPTMPCHVALARARKADFEKMTRERGRVAGKTIIPAMFRAVLALASPKAMAQHMPRMMMSNFDFIRVRLTYIDDAGGRGESSAVPLILAPSVVNTVLGFIEGALELAGYTSIESRYTDVVRDGQAHCYDIVTVRYEFSWRPKG
jgi:hypothetical protein